MASAGTAYITYEADFSHLQKGAKRATDGVQKQFRSSFAGIAKAAAGAFVGYQAVSFFKDSITEAREAAKVTKLTAQAIKTTGGAAHVSAKQVASLATAISNKTGIDDEAIQSGENLLLTFTNVRNEVGKGNDIFNQATSTVTDMSAALGQDMKSSSIQLGKALNDPIKGITALSRVGVSFTQQQKDQIKVLVASGDTLGAQKIILAELNKEFGGAAVAAADPMKKLGVVVGNLKERIGTALLPIIGKLADWLGKNLPAALEVVLPVMANVARSVVAFSKPIVEFFQQNPRALFVALGAAVGLLAIAMIAAAAPVTLIVGGLSLLAAGVAYAYTHFSAFRTVIDAVRAWLVGTLWPAIQVVATGIATAFGVLVGWVRKHWESIQQIIQGALAVIRVIIVAFTAIITTIWNTFGGILIALVKTVWALIAGVIQGAVNIISGIVRFFIAVFTGNWSAAWAAIQQIVAGAWTIIKAVITAQINGVLIVIRFVLAAIRLVWDTIWSAISGTIGAVWVKITGAVTTGINAVKNVITTIGVAIRAAWDAIWSGITGAIRGVWDTIGAGIKAGINIAIDAVNLLIDGLNKVSDLLPGVDFHIDHIAHLAGGGQVPSKPVHGGQGRLFLAQGGIPMSTVGGGFMTNGPRAIVGEGRQAYPEYVIPTDPKYRGRARGLLADASTKLFESGGVLPGGGTETGLHPWFLRALQAMFAANPNLTLVSGFRTRAQQEQLYYNYTHHIGGQALAARPGTSNHESGLAADIGPASQYGWLAANAGKFNLALTVRGEPWHVQFKEGGGSVLDDLGGIVGDALGALRKGAAMAAFAGPNLLADAAISKIPWDWLQKIVKAMKDKAYDWVKGEDDKLPVDVPLPGGVGGGDFTGPASGGLLGRVMAAIRQHESGGNYGAQNPYGSASGAYQVLSGTWNGYGGYPTAASAPPAVQDRFAAERMGPALARYGIGGVAGLWFVGDPARGQDPSSVGGRGNTGSVLDFTNYLTNAAAHIAGVPGYKRGGKLLFTFHPDNFDFGGTLQPGWNAVNNETGREEHLRPAGGRGGAALHIETAVFSDAVDVDLLTQKMAFAVAAGRL